MGFNDELRTNYAEATFDQVQKGQLALYLQVLNKFKEGEQVLTTIFDQNRAQLESLFYTRFYQSLPVVNQESFRNYGNREQEIVAWEKDQPNGVSLLTRPDGVRGVFIKHDDNINNWYELPKEYPENRIGDFFQTVVAKTILGYLIVNRNLVDNLAIFNQEQIDDHFAWVTRQIAGK